MSSPASDRPGRPSAERSDRTAQSFDATGREEGPQLLALAIHAYIFRYMYCVVLCCAVLDCIVFDWWFGTFFVFPYMGDHHPK